MKNFCQSLKSWGIVVAVCLSLSPRLVLGQKDNLTAQYDSWPTIVQANADKGMNKNGLVTPNYTVLGTSWNHRIITYYFENGTSDISGDDERDAIRQAFTYWSAQTDLEFLQVCSSFNADINFKWATGNHGDDVNFDGKFTSNSSGVILAHAYAPPPNGSNAGKSTFR